VNASWKKNIEGEKKDALPKQLSQKEKGKMESSPLCVYKGGPNYRKETDHSASLTEGMERAAELTDTAKGRRETVKEPLSKWVRGRR